MNGPLQYLPLKFQEKIAWLTSRKAHPKVVFIVLGILSTVWFLIRVIPKPSRATYPCMQATAPYMSSFVVWLLGVWGGLFSVKKWRFYLGKSRYSLAMVFMLTTALSYLLMQYALPLPAGAKPFDSSSNNFVPNNPIGQAKGIFPGRVVWFWDESATNENCTNTSNADGIINEADDAWFMGKNNTLSAIDSMICKSLNILTGEENIAGSWNSLFVYYNQNHDKGAEGYRQGEKIFIKVNATTALGGIEEGRFDAEFRRNDDQEVNNFAAETNPFVVLSILKQLVYEAGVPSANIYVGDPARNIYKEFYDLWKQEFPELNILGNNLIHPELEIAETGRIPVA
ncbi:MAG TPA: hypothetical protein VJ946_00675, partial [Bacteroidales bacterium]|nr:hypothetical protein [Bacteroidales bacterium]